MCVCVIMKQHMEYVLRLFISENGELHRKKSTFTHYF